MTVDTSRIAEVMARTFGFSSFRPLQEPIIQEILQGRDVFALLPTGGGKSLCYQLPALLQDGTTVVVSPLIALMKDQVDALRGLGVAATYINSSLDLDEIGARLQLVAQGRVKLLYVAPERLMMPGTLRLLDSIAISLFAIDEAHCISEWGHDFRPEYRELRRLRERFPGVPIVAFTATATSRVQTDIRTQLGLQQATAFRGSFNRANLYYEVRPKRDAYAQLLAYVRKRPNQSGIIYCSSRNATEELAGRLEQDGVHAAAYHAGLDAMQRQRRQDAFIHDDVRIIVATIAFGMGIDKPDVRFVIHYDLPKTLENYYQESGRAGRDGDPSECILFYSTGDVMRQRYFAAEKPPAERKIALQQLRRMTDWAESQTCRRHSLLAYFDEEFGGQEGPCCDVCRTPGHEADMTIPAQMFLSCLKRMGERSGAGAVIAVLRGSSAKNILDRGWETLSTYGIGRERSEVEWQGLAAELLRGGYVERVAPYDTLRVTERGRRVLFEHERVSVTIRQPVASDTSSSRPDSPYPDLFEQLRVRRKALADVRGLPPYAIFPDRSLLEMTMFLPVSRDGLMSVHGVGTAKAEEWGDAFLQVISAYVSDTGAKPVAAPPRKERKPKGSAGNTVWESVGLFQQGNDIAAIAEKRGLAQSTVEGHLAEAIAAGEELDLDRLVSPEKQKAIVAALRHVGGSRLAPVMEVLGEGYTYGELRFVLAAGRHRE